MATPPADPGHERLQRLWWAAPGAIVAGSAIGVAVVVGPTLGQQVSVPRQLVVPTTARTPAPAPSPAPADRHPHAHPGTTTTTPPPTAATSTRVVQPRHPVVTASADDSRDRLGDSTGRESGDR